MSGDAIRLIMEDHAADQGAEDSTKPNPTRGLPREIRVPRLDGSSGVVQVNVQTQVDHETGTESQVMPQAQAQLQAQLQAQEQRQAQLQSQLQEQKQAQAQLQYQLQFQFLLLLIVILSFDDVGGKKKSDWAREMMWMFKRCHKKHDDCKKHKKRKKHDWSGPSGSDVNCDHDHSDHDCSGSDDCSGREA